MNAQSDAPLPKTEQQIVQEIIESEKWRSRSANEKQITRKELGLGTTKNFHDAAMSSATMLSNFEALKRQVTERKRSAVKPGQQTLPAAGDAAFNVAIASKGQLTERESEEAITSDQQTPLPAGDALNHQRKRQSATPADMEARPCGTSTAVFNTAIATPDKSSESVVQGRSDQDDAVTFIGVVPRPSKRRLGSQTNWQCQQCTLVNTKYDLRCAVCQTRRL